MFREKPRNCGKIYIYHSVYPFALHLALPRSGGWSRSHRSGRRAIAPCPLKVPTESADFADCRARHVFRMWSSALRPPHRPGACRASEGGARHHLKCPQKVVPGAPRRWCPEGGARRPRRWCQAPPKIGNSGRRKFGRSRDGRCGAGQRVRSGPPVVASKPLKTNEYYEGGI